jgi:hypothetical protein
MSEHLKAMSDTRGASQEDLRELEEHLKEVKSIMERLGLETLTLGNNNDIPKRVTVAVKKGA